MSLIRAVKDAISGDFVSEEVREQRLSLCDKCNYKRGFGTCIKCGCFVQLKTWMPEESCPKGKWEESVAIKKDL